MKGEFKISDPDNHYVTTDPHFNHDLRAILQQRGCSNQEEANEMVIEKINSTVPEGSNLWMLGDVCLGDEENGNNLNSLLKRLNAGVIYALWGNHNSGMSRLYRRAIELSGIQVSKKRAGNIEIYPMTFNLGGKDNKRIVFLGDRQEVVIGDGYDPVRNKGYENLFILDHFPVRTWHHCHRGSIHLCGHSHGNDKSTNYATSQSRCFDMSIDSTPPRSFKFMQAKALKNQLINYGVLKGS